MRSVLLIGYGNPGRGDDGLGPAFAEAMGRLNLEGLTVDADYQLTVEDAADVARHNVVVFADADAAAETPFYFRPITPEGTMGISSHSVSAETVVKLAHDLFGAATAGYMVGIRGRCFDAFTETMSADAAACLDAAVTALTPVFRSGDFAAAVATFPPRPENREPYVTRQEESCETENL